MKEICCLFQFSSLKSFSCEKNLSKDLKALSLLSGQKHLKMKALQKLEEFFEAFLDIF